MKAILSIVVETLAGSVLLQSYFDIWHPSSFGRFADFPLILIYATCIITATFLLLVMPGFYWLRRSHRKITPLTGFLAGLLFGCIVMLVFMALTGWPVRVAE